MDHDELKGVWRHRDDGQQVVLVGVARYAEALLAIVHPRAAPQQWEAVELEAFRAAHVFLGAPPLAAERAQASPQDHEEPMASWGRWQYMAHEQVLVFDDGAGHLYDVALSELRTAAAMLEKIFVLTSKRWMRSEDLGDLLRALEALLEPQTTLCAGGVEQGPLEDVGAVIEARRRFDDQIRRALGSSR